MISSPGVGDGAAVVETEVEERGASSLVVGVTTSLKVRVTSLRVGLTSLRVDGTSVKVAVTVNVRHRHLGTD